MINANQTNCTACTACLHKCPVGCISFKQDNEGFFYASVDTEKCINCNICNKVCPEKNLIRNQNKSKVYAVKLEDTNIRLKSSSGGVFISIAMKVLSQNGFVCGAIYDDDMKVVHCCTNGIDIVKKMMGSKYVQSDLNDSFVSVKKILENKNVPILFTGTPCQVAGLKKYLNKDYDQLITIQLVCHGVPSPKLFEKYKEYLTKKLKIRELKLLTFRDNNKFKITVYDEKNFFKWNGNADLYLRPYIKGKNYRMVCYDCKYSNNHIADFTIGDFWGLEELEPSFCDGKGVSICMINSSKGEKLFDSIEGITSISMKYSEAAKNNQNLIRPSVKDPDRDYFYDGIDENDYFESLKKYIPLYIKLTSRLPLNYIEKFYRVLKRHG